MSRTTKDLWLEDRQGVVDRDRDHAWWVCVHWVFAAGLLCVLLLWGWFTPLLVVLMIGAFTALARLHYCAQAGVRVTSAVLDLAVASGLLAVGAAGLAAGARSVGLLVLLFMACASPPVRRTLREVRVLMVWSRNAARESRTRTTPPWTLRPGSP